MDKELFKTQLTKNGQSFAYIPMTERVRALREWDEYKGYGIITDYEFLNIVIPVGSELTETIRCVVHAKITNAEGRVVSTGLDSCPYLFTTFKDPTKLQEDTDFCAKAESGAISRALQNLGIALPTKEELEAKESAKNGGGRYNAVGNTRTAPAAPNAPFSGASTTTRTDDSQLIEKFTNRTVADLRANGGAVVKFDTGDYQLKYNPEKQSYYWSNVDKTVTEHKYIPTTVTKNV